MKNYLILIIIVLVVVQARGQYPSPDSYSYSELDQKIEELGNDGGGTPYLKAYLRKAKAEGNYTEMVNGYKNYLHAAPEKARLIYADSMVIVAKRSGDQDLLGSAYLTKGIVYFSQKQHMKALDLYLAANHQLSSGTNEYLKNKVKYNIANIKYYLGHYRDAEKLYKECIEYFRDENAMAYLSCLHSLGLCYNRMGSYELCSTTNALALRESARLKVSSMDQNIRLSQGINLYYLGQYSPAEIMIRNAMKAIQEEGDFANESVAYFYLAKSYMALGKEELALRYFRQVDKIFNDRSFLRPDLREGYEYLIRNSREKKNIKGELYYVNQLLKADSLLNADYRYLSLRLHRDYDTELLIKAKTNLETQLSQRKLYERLFIVGVLALFIVLLYLIYRYFQSRQHYKRSFEALINGIPGPAASEKIQNPHETTPLQIKPEVVDFIITGLDKFENQHTYLFKDLTVGRVADIIGTNAKYLSKVIADRRGKKFIHYINDLKVDYIVDLLKSQGKYRNYTNKALAEEAGFSSTQLFTSAFIKRTEITPTFFINELKKIASNSIGTS